MVPCVFVAHHRWVVEDDYPSVGRVVLHQLRSVRFVEAFGIAEVAQRELPSVAVLGQVVLRERPPPFAIRR
jgi:hypothetical protein